MDRNTVLPLIHTRVHFTRIYKTPRLGRLPREICPQKNDVPKSFLVLHPFPREVDSVYKHGQVF